MSKNSAAVVASGHPEVTAAAATILAQGGNAFDGAIAAGFAAAVAEPALTSLGGGGFLLARSTDHESVLFDFFVDTPGLGRDPDQLEPHFFPVTVQFPGAAQDFNVGLGSVAVPGNLKGFLHVHDRLGRLPLATILDPAIRLAREGHRLNSSQGYFLNLLKPIMTLTPAGRSLFQPAGRYLAPGDILKNPDLATFLENLPADRGQSFYKGELAHRITRDMRQGRGILTYDDLAAFRVIERAPLSANHGDYTLLTNPPPSMGGSLIGLGLSLMAEMGATEWGARKHVLFLSAVQKEMERLREEGLDAESRAEASLRLKKFSRGTTHVSVADRFGNVAGMTTSNGEGSGYIVPDTGIMLNNMMGEDDLHPDGFHASPPGRRVASMMSPSLLLEKDTVRLVLGSGGSKRIRTAILQVLINVVDCGLNVEDAVKAPRMHWDGEMLQVEPGYPEEAMAALKKLWPINVWQERDMYFGGVHAVVPGVAGSGDPRRGGCQMTEIRSQMTEDGRQSAEC